MSEFLSLLIALAAYTVRAITVPVSCFCPTNLCIENEIKSCAAVPRSVNRKYLFEKNSVLNNKSHFFKHLATLLNFDTHYYYT